MPVMAILSIPAREQTVTDTVTIQQYLYSLGLAYEQWHPATPIGAEASNDAVLQAYDADIKRLQQERGYVAADVVNLSPATHDLEALLAKFDKEHTHNDDEVRFTVAGRGIFSINPGSTPVVHVLVEAGDLLVVPAQTRHWFTLCEERRICTIRLFKDATGWTPHYTNSALEQQYPAKGGDV
jgi:1,2-dihydroxy-3-keto-5-methylthiopentene dioxygenase